MMGKLAGLRIVNTRPLIQAAEFDAALRAEGARPISYPCIEISAPDDLNALEEGLNDLANGSYDWLLLTSSNAVQALVNRGFIVDGEQPFRVAAVGSVTRSRAERLLGVTVEFVPSVQTSIGLAETMPLSQGERMLLPVSKLARPDLPDILRQRGALLTSICAYHTLTGSGGADLPLMLRCREVDAFAFASPSAISGLLTRLAQSQVTVEMAKLLPALCIGSTTAETARAHGFHTRLISASPTVSALIDALASIRSNQQQGENNGS